MANTKISQLPSYTGTAADLRWFVMNNSGQSETFKFSGYTSQLVPGTGTNSLRTLNATSAIGEDSLSIGPTNIASNFASIAIGRNNQSTNDLSYAIGGSSIVSGFVSLVLGYSTSVSGQYSVGLGAESNIAGSFSFGVGRFINVARNFSNAIGTNTNITNGQYQNTIGTNHNITSSGEQNSIFGGFGNTISGATSGATLVGLSGYTDANINDCAYVNNLQVLRTPSTRVQSVSSGTTFTCNLNLGAKSQFYITGTSTINITNVRDGASFMIKTQTDGNYVMTWTATGGYTFVFEGGIKDPGNNVTDIFVFEVFGSVIYGNRRHNYS